VKKREGWNNKGLGEEKTLKVKRRKVETTFSEGLISLGGSKTKYMLGGRRS